MGWRKDYPPRPPYLCVEPGQLLLIQVGLLVHTLLIAKLPWKQENCSDQMSDMGARRKSDLAKHKAPQF